MEKKELVSIIIPTCNRDDLIEETIISVLSQTYNNIEVIIVDDHSSETTITNVKSILNKYLSQATIRFIENEGKGACAARNTGFRHSNGQYIQFFDDDDLMLPSHIEEKVKAFKEGVDYVACNYTFFNSEDPSVIIDRKDISSIKHTAAAHILLKSLPTPCFMCTRDTINKIGLWNENIKKLQDFSYFHRLFLNDCRGKFLDEYLFTVRIHPKSMTRSNINAVEGQIYSLQSMQSVKSEWKEVGGAKWKSIKLPIIFMEFTTGRNLYLKGFKRKGIMLLVKLAINNPYEILQLVLKSIKYKTSHLTEVLVKESTL